MGNVTSRILLNHIMQLFIFIIFHPGFWKYCVYAPDFDIVNGL